MERSRLRTGLVIIALVGLAIASRLVPHPPNFQALGAIALFSGFYFASNRYAWLVPMAAMLISNALLGGYDFWQMLLVNFAIVLPAFVGHLVHAPTNARGLKGVLVRATRVAGLSVAGSVVFFAISNLAVWLFSGMYPLTLDGLVVCFLVALPFYAQDTSLSYFGNLLLGDLFFNGLLFGAYALAVARFRQPVLSNNA